MNRPLRTVLTINAALALIAVIAFSTIAQTTRPASQPAHHGHGHSHDHGSALHFDLKDPKAVNAVVFIVDSKLEPFVGTADGITGHVLFDPNDPTTLAGEVLIDAKSIQTTNSKMSDVLHGADWIDANGNPQASFKFEYVRPVPGKIKTYQVDGVLSIAGVELKKTVELSAEVVANGAKKRGGAKSGDLIVLRSEFEINRRDFGIKTDMGNEKVGNKIDVIVKIAGYQKP